MASLVETILTSLTSQVTGPLSAQLGEPEAAVRQGAQAGGAAILAGLASKASDTGLLSSVFNMAKSAVTNPTVASGTAATGLLSSLFGPQLGTVAETIAKTAGLSPSAGTALLSSIVPGLMSVLGGQINAGGLTPTSLGSTLVSSVGDLKRFLPAGLTTSVFSGLAGLAAMPAVASRASGVIASRVTDVVEEKRGNSWLLPLIIGLAVLAGLIWYFTSNHKAVTDTASSAATSASNAVASGANATADAAKSAWAATLGAFGNRKLPDGTELNIPANGVENKLLDFISSSKPVDDTTWFDFDRLTFDTGAATLQASSQDQLANIAKILAAYPKTKVRVGGYTDNTGNAAANLKLSQARAETVVAQLTQLGVAADRLSAKGYGEEHPVADNSTDEGRQKNRRISMRVTEK
jgi:OOP family OmpA-OmpF porin